MSEPRVQARSDNKLMQIDLAPERGEGGSPPFHEPR
jgi:hypothetical protein